MLEDQVAYLLQRYLGNYVRGLNKEALKISVWQGDVELKNMQLKPEALNALKLPVKVKAGFLGSVKLKVPWSRLGQDPVLVYLDRIFLLAESATQVEGCTEDAVQEAKKNRIQEMEMKLWEKSQQLKSEMNKSWLGSLISTIIGNLKLSISNVHIRYEDLESNPGHPFAAGVRLEKLSAVTVDDSGKETFITGGALDRIQKSVELDQLAAYLDSDIIPWHVSKPWEDLLPSEWFKVFKFGTKDGKAADYILREHSYILQPVTGQAKYSKLRLKEVAETNQPLHTAVVNLDDVTICLFKDGYRDILKLADNFAAFNQRLKYAHYRPLVAVKDDPRSWWIYAYKAVSDQMKKASGKMSWEQVLRYASLRKRYISLYASLLKSDPIQVTISDNKEIEELDRELNIELILQWRMLAHKFVDQSVESDLNVRKQKAGKSWWPFGGTSESPREESEAFHFSAEDLNRLNKIIGYKEGDDEQSIISSKVDALHTFLIIHMKHNASKLIGEVQESVAELSCEDLNCSIKLYPETKVFDMKLGSYQLLSPKGLLAESAASHNSLVGVFSYKPFDEKVDWSMIAKASPCYMTYLKESIDQIMNFFESNSAVSQTIVRETAAAVQTTIDEVKRTAQQQMNRALKDQARFSLDLDIAAPKITIPTDFCPDNTHATKLLLDLGNLVIRTQQDDHQRESDEDMYLQFDLVLSDVSAFFFDGDYHWRQISLNKSANCTNSGFFQIIDKCGVILHLQQIRLETPYYPSTRIAVQLPSLGFHFSPARYHRLMKVIKIFEGQDGESSKFLRPWNQADLEGWLSLLTWKGVGSREAVWQRRYFCLVGPFLYVLESPDAKSYKQFTSLRGKQIYQVPPEFVGNAEHVLAVCAPKRSSSKVVEDTNALILRCESEDLRRTWQSRIQGAIYHSSDSAPISGLSDTSSDTDDIESEQGDKGVTDVSIAEKLFVTGILDELKVCFSYSYQSDQSLMKVLLAEEKHLFEFRAIGGQVELSIRENDIFIGTILKSLEIEDLVCCSEISRPCYLARSFIGTADTHSFYDSMRQGVEISDLTPTETGEKFYEAPDTLADVDSPMQSPGGTSDCLSSSQGQVPLGCSSSGRPKFSRVAGLLPSDTSTEGIEPSYTLESFIKAQIVIYDQNSPQYNNIDKQVRVTLATLTFFCRRPTILAIMEFINSINIEDKSLTPSNESSSTAIVKHDLSRDVDDFHSTTIEEPAIKGLLGSGKYRTMFNLTLKMAQAQIHLMNENETKLASLSQENLLTDIKVFPSSFSIKAALGNLRICDDSLPSSHLYYWACDMRNPGGSSFVELVFTSFNKDDEDYKGYDYSLFGELSEVRIVYLNRFVQEVVGYFMGLVPNSPKGIVKLTDQVTNSEKWFQASEIEGSPAMKLDLSLRKPIILMPRRTDSLDFLRLDIVHITVKNTFEWIGGSRSEMNSIHLETMMVQVEDINLNVGTGTEIGESIIQDVNGLSVIIHRSLRDLLHQLPSIETIIKIEELKAAMSNKEYKIITECAVSNISEAPQIPPALNQYSITSSSDATGDIVPQETNDVDSRTTIIEAFISLKVSVSIKLVELSLYSGVSRDASLATVQVSGAWLLYKSSTSGEGFLSATLQDFSVFDDREGVEQEFQLAIGKPKNFGSRSLNSLAYDYKRDSIDSNITQGSSFGPVPTMLIVDVKISQMSTFVTLCVQRPQLLVALDFLLAVVEFFVPTVSSMLSNEEDNSSHIVDAIFLDQSIFRQPCAEFSLYPQKPLIIDDENFDHFIYDGGGGTLFLKDTRGFNLTAPSSKALIHVGNGKKLQFKNVVIKSGHYLDSCVSLGASSSYSASKDDHVYLEGSNESPQPNSVKESVDEVPSQNTAVTNSTEFIIELQAVGPELTFYNTSKDAGELLHLSNKLLHAQLDAFCRFVLKGNNTEMSADALGLTMESNGIRILEPFDTTLKYSNSSGKTNIHLFVSDIFMNFTFSILRLFLAVEDDILSFLRTTSKKVTIVCSHFDKVGTIKNTHTDQIYVFWRPRAPPGFAVLGDYLTPLDKPPAKGVLAVNTNSIRVKKPINFRLIWPPSASGSLTGEGLDNSELFLNNAQSEGDDCCSIWFPEAPKGYVALGCVVTHGKSPPPLSSAFCIPSSSVSPCSLRDCITINSTDIRSSDVAFWRVDNSVGTFLPADCTTLSLRGKAYELRHIKYDFLKATSAASDVRDVQTPGGHQTLQSEQCTDVNSNRRFEPVASFQLIWWNQGLNSRKKLSIWRPVVPDGMIYFGDVAVKGFEPPNTCIVLHDSSDENLFKAPQDFQLVGQIKKQRGMESISFWLPQAPPGYVSLGCVACKGKPKQNEFHNLRCMRSDLVTGGQFLEESVWDTSESKHTAEPFGIWAVGNELGTFIVRGGFKRPPRRFALRLADSSVPSGSDTTVIDAGIGTFSVALFDDYGGLMVPLFNISLIGIAFGLHGRTEYLSCTVSFSLSARSYNDKYEAWEPLVEPLDGFLRYQYDPNAPGAASQLRFTSTRDLNLNVSVSNANIIIQGYASWSNLSHAEEYCKNRDSFSPTHGRNSILDTLHKRNYYIIPQNKLGQDIFIRATEVRGLQNIIQMPSGDMKAVKVPVSKNMLDSHLKGRLCKKPRRMVTVIIADAQFPRVEGSALQQYTVAIRLSPDQSLSTDALLHQQSARTCASGPCQLLPPDLELVEWNEIFFFKVDSLDHYSLELIVIDMSRGAPMGFFSASLNQIARTIEDLSSPHNFANKLTWIDLSAENSMSYQDNCCKLSGKLHCAILVQNSEVEDDGQLSTYNGRGSGFIQISPSKEGPWTTVRLNYSAPAACWRLGNDVVASEVSVKDGNRYVNIRSLVSVHNNTDLVLDLCLTSKTSWEKNTVLRNPNNSESIQIEGNRVQTDEFFETEKYNPHIGWIGCLAGSGQAISEGGKSQQVFSGVELPSGWEWIDDWHLDTTSTNTADGWIYAPDVESLRWPESFEQKESVNSARQRRWLRSRKLIVDDLMPGISVGLLQPGETVPLPLSGLIQSGQYFLQLRPWNSANPDEYSWSSVLDGSTQPDDAGKPRQISKLCVSALSESEELLCCSEINGTSDGSHKLWFCVSIQATEIAKDIHSDPIQDWSLVVKSPLMISNFLPLAAEYSVLEMQSSGHFIACSRGIFLSGKTVQIYSADIRNPLFLSLLPQRGWLPIHEAVLISHPHGIPSKTISLRSSVSGRVVQIIIDQNYDKEHPLLAKTIRLYAPYWVGVARCPPLRYRILDMSGKKRNRFQTNKKNGSILEEITEEEIYEGYTIASALNFNILALSVAVAQTGSDQFGPVKDLVPLGDLDGSMDIYAYDADGNFLRLFISTKPCPHQSVPTKIITVRPFMTFTNRFGQDIFLKLSSEDEPKVLHPSDSRVSFVYRGAGGSEKLQVRLEDTNWSFPVQISKEDTITILLRRHDGTLKFLRTEIRGYEEGSRFIVVFRLGSTAGPIRIENRTTSKELSIRQAGFGEDDWVQLQPLSTTNFSWDDPYGQMCLDAKLSADHSTAVWKLDLGRTGLCSADSGLQFHVIEEGDITIVKFRDDSVLNSSSCEEITGPTLGENLGVSRGQADMQISTTPFELLIELGVVGISIVDHRPKELSYFYLERVFLSYSTGFDGGRTSRFKLIFGYLQVDNQLPLTLMPVLLAPEQASDVQHPVFKMTITMQNENKDGVEVYPYVYIRVTERCWRLDIHEPMIWAIVDFFNNLQIDRFPKSSTVIEVDPEIRFNLIDVSEIRLKLSLETAPGQRPHGVLGIWSPVLSAVGNAFKIQVHLRRVMHRDRFMRKSSIIPAIGNRIWRDLIHNPLHLIFSVDVLGMTSSTLASLSRGFAELSTDGQFLQLRAKQVRSRRITGVGDGIIQGTEALAQGVAFGVSGVVRKPVESARENGLLGLAHGLGRAFLGFIVQPVSGALDFFSLTVDGIGASCSKCFEVFHSKTTVQRIRNPRAIHADGVLREYCEREAIGQMVLYLGEASRHFGCTEIFKEPSKFALSDYYEEHFNVPYQRIVLVTNKRIMLLQCLAPDKMDKKPCKIMWDVPWDELMALELAKAGSNQPSHLILHLKNFRRSENFVRVIKCSIVEEEFEGREPQAVKICSLVRRTWKKYQYDMKSLILKVPSSQRNVYFAWSEADGRESRVPNKAIISSRELLSHTTESEDRRFIKHSITFSKIWSSEQEYKSRCSLCRKQISQDGGICSIWRPVCPDGYTYIGDIAHVGIHPPNVAAVYRKIDGLFAVPVGYDLVWRNCIDDYVTPVSIWHPRAPDGFVSPGCVAIAGYKEPEPDLVFCVAESLVEETEFEEQKIWSARDAYPWACHIYQVQSDALHFVALRQSKEESEWKPMRVRDDPLNHLQLQSS